MLLANALTAQQDWLVRVRDLATGQGIPNVIVDARTSQTKGTTDATGLVELRVKGLDTGEALFAHGLASHNYTVGNYPTGAPRDIWLVPYAMFHKTGLIPVSGTTSPIVFQGVAHTFLGANPYTIEVEVPPNVLPVAADFWIVPVPPHASPYPQGADAGVSAAVAQFAVELKDGNGKNIDAVLPDPGVVVRFSPTWYTYGQIAQHQGIVQATQYRLTQTSQAWDPQPDACHYDPATGMFTAHLRACSWWWILPFVPFLAGDSRPAAPTTPTPPPPPVDILESDCPKSSLVCGTFATCGRINGGNCSVTLGNNGQVSFSAQFAAGITASLGIAPSNLAAVITRISASLGASASVNAQGGFDVSVNGSTSGSLANGDGTGPNTGCYSGTASIGLWNKEYTLKVGSATFPLLIPLGIVKKYCLDRDPTCHEECGSVFPVHKEIVVPKGLKVCAGDLLNCR